MHSFQSSKPSLQFLYNNIPHSSLSLKVEPKGSPKYVIGSLDTLHPKISNKASAFDTRPTRTNSNFPKFVFNPKMACNHAKTSFKCQIRSGLAPPQKKCVV